MSEHRDAMHLALAEALVLGVAVIVNTDYDVGPMTWDSDGRPGDVVSMSRSRSVETEVRLRVHGHLSNDACTWTGAGREARALALIKLASNLLGPAPECYERASVLMAELYAECEKRAREAS